MNPVQTESAPRGSTFEIPHRWLIAGFIVLHVALVAAAIAALPRWSGDTSRYVQLAHNILDGHGFSIAVNGSFEPEGLRLPGYPLFLAACWRLLGSSEIAVVVVQAMLFLGAVCVFAVLSRDLIGETGALTFLGFSAVYPFVAAYSAQLISETLCVALVAAIYFALRKITITRGIIAGTIVGVTGYVRPDVLPIGLAIAAGLVLADRRLVREAFCFVAMSLIVATPWAIRNYREFGVRTPGSIAPMVGTSMFMASWAPRVSERALAEWSSGRGIPPELERVGMMRQVRAAEATPLPVRADTATSAGMTMARDRVYRDYAVANIKTWPLSYAMSVAARMARMWFTVAVPGALPGFVDILVITEGVVVFLLGIFGIIVAVRHADSRRRPLVYALVAGMAYYCASHSIFHTEARYTIPVRLPLLLFAAMGAVFIERRVRSRGFTAADTVEPVSQRAPTSVPLFEMSR